MSAFDFVGGSPKAEKKPLRKATKIHSLLTQELLQVQVGKAAGMQDDVTAWAPTELDRPLSRNLSYGHHFGALQDASPPSGKFQPLQDMTNLQAGNRMNSQHPQKHGSVAHKAAKLEPRPKNGRKLPLALRKKVPSHALPKHENLDPLEQAEQRLVNRHRLMQVAKPPPPPPKKVNLKQGKEAEDDANDGMPSSLNVLLPRNYGQSSGSIPKFMAKQIPPRRRRFPEKDFLADDGALEDVCEESSVSSTASTEVPSPSSSTSTEGSIASPKSAPSSGSKSLEGALADSRGEKNDSPESNEQLDEQRHGPRVRDTWQGCFGVAYPSKQHCGEDTGATTTPSNNNQSAAEGDDIDCAPFLLETKRPKVGPPAACGQGTAASSRPHQGKVLIPPKTNRNTGEQHGTRDAGRQTRHDTCNENKLAFVAKASDAQTTPGPTLPAAAKPEAKDVFPDSGSVFVPSIKARPGFGLVWPGRQREPAEDDASVRVGQMEHPSQRQAQGSKRKDEREEPSIVDDQATKKLRPAVQPNEKTARWEALGQAPAQANPTAAGAGTNTSGRNAGTVASLEGCIDAFCDDVQRSVLMLRSNMKQALGVVRPNQLTTPSQPTRPVAPQANPARPVGQQTRPFPLQPPPMGYEQLNGLPVSTPAYGYAQQLDPSQFSQAPSYFYDTSTGSCFTVPSALYSQMPLSHAWSQNAPMATSMQPNAAPAAVGVPKSASLVPVLPGGSRQQANTPNNPEAETFGSSDPDISPLHFTIKERGSFA